MLASIFTYYKALVRNIIIGACATLAINWQLISAEEENERKLQQQATNSELIVMLVDPNNKSVMYLDPQKGLVTLKTPTLHPQQFEDWQKDQSNKDTSIKANNTKKD